MVTALKGDENHTLGSLSLRSESKSVKQIDFFKIKYLAVSVMNQSIYR